MSGRNARERYDVVLSFAGEDRPYVSSVANKLSELGVSVFYDEFQVVDLWGKDLYQHLDNIYRKAGRYCIVFVSKHYARKVWTSHEHRSAQARALTQNQEYVLPARFDDTDLPGMRPTIGYVDLKRYTPEQFAEIVAEKIGPGAKTEFLPLEPNRFYKNAKLKTKLEKECALDCLRSLFHYLKAATKSERRLIYLVVSAGCPAELPENMHINVDYLRRLSGYSRTRLLHMSSKIDSLHFKCSLRIGHDKDGSEGEELLYLEWHDTSIDGLGNATFVLFDLVSVLKKAYCDQHGIDAFERLDLSALA